MTKPRLLDLFCCEGGAGQGYSDAGWDVTGVDVKDYSRRYPGRFIQADALDYVREHGHEYDAIHASPPCQGYSIATRGLPDRAERYQLLIPATREALRATGRPYVIENVTGARHELHTPMLLCGTMFGLTATDEDGTPLRLERHRWFESSHLLVPPGPCRHDKAVAVGGVYGGGRADRHEAKHIRRGGYTPAKTVRAALMGGVDWMTLHGLSQALPPVYTEWIGAQLIGVNA